jgi:hypothetical protein
MQVDKRLNLVLEIERDGAAPVYVHSQPVKTAIYEANWRLIFKTAVGMYSDDLGPAACARVAALALKDTAKEMDGPESNAFQAQASALMNEIERLANVTVSTAQGWQTIPLTDALKQKLLDDDEVSEVRSTITFFTLASWFHKMHELKNTYEILKRHGAQIVSSNCTEYASSLPTWKPEGNTGAKVIPSSIAH